MITLSWIIERLLVKPTEGTLTDVVITADWRCNGSQESFSGTCYGSCSFAPPSGSFTPYADLTEQQVLDWCYANGVDKTAIEANVTLQIENQINPPVVSLPLPWVPPVVVEIVPPLVEQKVPVLVAEPVNTETPVAAVDEQPVVSDAPAA
jgi:hypothetical protein